MQLAWFAVPQAVKAGWEREWPDRLRWEIKTLNQYGRVLSVARGRGRVRIDMAWPVRGADEMIAIEYVPGFPYVRPDIYLLRDAAGRPRRHCDPISGRLCYLGHARMAWSPNLAVAELIRDALPMILSGDGAEEEPVGEPAEAWWAHDSPGDSIFVVESGWGPGEHQSGDLLVKGIFSKGKPPELRCMVEAVEASGLRLHASSYTVPVEFASAPTIRVPWFRFDEELWPVDEAAVLDRILLGAGDVRQLERVSDTGRARLVGAVFRTEVVRGRWDWSWLLLMLSGTDRSFRKGDGAIERRVVRTLRAGADDRMARARSAAPLTGKRIVLAGVGAIGAPIALELSRNGIARLGLVDDDRVTPGNAVRWPFGESAWGRSKLEVLKAEIARASATVCIDCHPFLLGTHDLDLSGPGAPLGCDLAAADIIVDATASFDPLRILWDRARRSVRTLVSVGATPTLEGGEVVVYAPGGGCPVCLVRHRVDGAIPSPAGESGDANAVELPGCAEATFAGASFDLQELSLAATRIVVAELRAPSTSSFVDVLGFGEADRLPSWCRHTFSRHVDCDCR